MPLFQYKIVTTNSSGDGQIEAASRQEAEETLTAQHVPKDHGFVDEKGNPKEHNLVELQLEEIV